MAPGGQQCRAAEDVVGSAEADATGPHVHPEVDAADVCGHRRTTIATTLAEPMQGPDRTTEQQREEGDERECTDRLACVRRSRDPEGELDPARDKEDPESQEEPDRQQGDADRRRPIATTPFGPDQGNDVD